MNGRFAIVAVLLSGCYMSFGSPPDAECVEDAECREGFECSESGRCLCSASTCTGCCSVDRNECRTGLDDTSCGRRGETCEDCTTRDKHCDDGNCVEDDDCTDECAFIGDLTCVTPTAWALCDDHDGDGCLDWSAPEECLDTQSCAGGGCVSSCTNECTAEGVPACHTASSWHECRLDDRNCLVWGEEQDCAGGLVCDGGVCLPGECTDECSYEGELGCTSEVHWAQCGWNEGLECYQWVLGADCPDGEVCEEGLCVTACGPGGDCPEGTTCVEGLCVCEDDCEPGEAQCTAEGGLQECGDHDSDDCFDWSEAVPCPEDTHCLGDSCQPDCTTLCEVGVSQCNGTDDAVVECQLVDSCPEWVEIEPCIRGARCFGASCVECGDCDRVDSAICAGASSRRICRNSGSGCLSWSDEVACPESHPFCEDGDCKWTLTLADDGSEYTVQSRGHAGRTIHAPDGCAFMTATMGDVDGDTRLEVVSLLNCLDIALDGGEIRVMSTTGALEWANRGGSITRYSLLLVDYSGDGTLDIVHGHYNHSVSPLRASVIETFHFSGVSFDLGPYISGPGDGIGSLDYVPPDVIRGTSITGTEELCMRFDGSHISPCPD